MTTSERSRFGQNGKIGSVAMRSKVASVQTKNVQVKNARRHEKGAFSVNPDRQANTQGLSLFTTTTKACQASDYCKADYVNKFFNECMIKDWEIPCTTCGQRASLRSSCCAKDASIDDDDWRLPSVLAIRLALSHMEHVTSSHKIAFHDGENELWDAIEAYIYALTRVGIVRKDFMGYCGPPIRHLTTVSYGLIASHVYTRATLTDRHCWPAWFKLVRDETQPSFGMNIGLIRGLNDMDGFGIAVISANHNGQLTRMRIWCYPHYEVYDRYFVDSSGRSVEEVAHSWEQSEANFWDVAALLNVNKNERHPGRRIEMTDLLHAWTAHEHDDITNHTSMYKSERQDHYSITNSCHPHGYLPRRRGQRIGQADPARPERPSKSAFTHDADDTYLQLHRQNGQTNGVQGDSEIGRMHNQALSVPAWKNGPGRSKSWKGSRYVKGNRNCIDLGLWTLKTGLRCASTVIYIPRYQLSKQGYRTGGRRFSNNLFNRNRLGKAHEGLRQQLGLDDERYGISEHDESIDETASIEQYQNRVTPPPTSLKQLLASTTIPRYQESDIHHEYYCGAIIAPHYVLLEALQIKQHHSIFRAAHLNDDRQRYIMTCIEMSSISQHPKKQNVIRYRMDLVKSIQKRDGYLNTIMDRGCLWLVQHDHDIHQSNKSHRSKTDNEHTRAFLRRGTKDFKEAFPRLPRPSPRGTERSTCLAATTTPPATINPGLDQVEQEKVRNRADKKRVAQCQRRARKRANKRAEREAQTTPMLIPLPQTLDPASVRNGIGVASMSKLNMGQVKWMKYPDFLGSLASFVQDRPA